MADDDDWFGGGGDDDAPVEIKPLGKKAAEEPPPAAAAEGAGPPQGEAPGEAQEEVQEEALEEDYLDPDKLLLFKHWIRPKFLPYKYLYMYRKNYYDDVMDYLDKRSRGIYREIPRAETWPERIMRTYSNKLNKYAMFTKRIQEDLAFAEMTKSSGNFFYYHAKNVFDRQFSPLLH